MVYSIKYHFFFFFKYQVIRRTYGLFKATIVLKLFSFLVTNCLIVINCFSIATISACTSQCPANMWVNYVLLSIGCSFVLTFLLFFISIFTKLFVYLRNYGVDSYYIRN